MVAVLLETVLQVKKMIRANDLKHTDVCYFYGFFVSKECSHILAHLVLLVFGMHLLWKTNGYFLVYFKWNKLEEVIG